MSLGIALPTSLTYDELKSKFYELDEDGTGALTPEELGPMCADLGWPEGFASLLAMMYDADGDGCITFDEFMSAYFPDHSKGASVGSPDDEVNPAPPPEEMDLDEGEVFEDSSFPLEDSTKRALHIGGSSARLFDNIEPNDIMQGGLGDCWLMAAFAGMAEFPGLIEQCFQERTVQESGMYHVNMWDGKKWNSLVIDDQIPVGWSGSPKYSQPADNELWVLLLEKAVAKWNGGYENLNGGLQQYAWRILCGCEDAVIYRQKKEEQPEIAWQECSPCFGDPKDVHDNCSFYLGKDLSRDQVWNDIKQWDASNFLLGASTNKDGGGAGGGVGHSAGESIRGDGIVKGHAYSIIRVVTTANGGRFVQLRNPWGNSTEWSGPWSDNSDEWDENPDVADELCIDHKDDGMFWMAWEDFEDVFEMVACGKVKQPVPKRQQLSEDSAAPPFNRRARTGKKPRPFCGTNQACAVM